MPRQITVEIDENGKATVHAEGYVGPACTKALKELYDKLKCAGIEINQDSQKLTPEYYRQATTQKTTIHT